MNSKFISTEDQSGRRYNINCAEIALIEETDSKYTRVITLNILDEMGNSIKIESIHSVKELQNLIQNR